MATITHIELRMINLVPKVKRVDAIQSFVSQETPILTVTDSDGAQGTGYCYTIGTGGPSVMALLEKTLCPALIGRDADRLEGIWRDLLFLTHATAVGAITSLALAAIDTALWDLRCRKQGLPLWKAAGGSRDRIPLYSTEGGWLHLDTQALVDDALAMQAQGFRGSKIKIGRDHLSEDAARLAAVRDAVGPGYEILTDDVLLGTNGDRHHSSPWGVSRGGEGSKTAFTIIRDGERMPIDASSNRTLRRGDIFEMLISGGGGWGDPGRRKPALVHEDIRSGRATPECAREYYPHAFNDTELEGLED